MNVGFRSTDYDITHYPVFDLSEFYGMVYQNVCLTSKKSIPSANAQP